MFNLVTRSTLCSLHSLMAGEKAHCTRCTKSMTCWRFNELNTYRYSSRGKDFSCHSSLIEKYFISLNFLCAYDFINIRIILMFIYWNHRFVLLVSHCEVRKFELSWKYLYWKKSPCGTGGHWIFGESCLFLSVSLMFSRRTWRKQTTITRSVI